MLTMADSHCYDRYLSTASGSPDQQKRELGNRLRADLTATSKEWQQELDRFLPAGSDLEGLPDGCWLLTLTFILARPFTSKAEGEFHPYEERRAGNRAEWFEVQNPIVRDHLTGLPLVKPTTWKGHLRFAARLANVPKTQVDRLFGEILEDEDGRAGRLHFFPTFFTSDVQREVITPLRRSTRTPARGPLDLEVIPKGASGTFCLFYLPHPKGHGWSPGQIADDLEAVAPALKAMFLDYGFSAKKTAGWGVVEDKVSNGSLCARGAKWPAPGSAPERAGGPSIDPPEDAFLPLMDEAGIPKAGVRKPDGVWWSNTEFNRLVEKPSSGNVYGRFRRWYDAHGPEWRGRLSAGGTPSAVPVQTYPVKSVTALSNLVARLTGAIRAEDANE